MVRRKPTTTLFPYTTLFQSLNNTTLSLDTANNGLGTWAIAGGTIAGGADQGSHGARLTVTTATATPSTGVILNSDLDVTPTGNTANACVEFSGALTDNGTVT